MAPLTLRSGLAKADVPQGEPDGAAKRSTFIPHRLLEKATTTFFLRLEVEGIYRADKKIVTYPN